VRCPKRESRAPRRDGLEKERGSLALSLLTTSLWGGSKGKKETSTKARKNKYSPFEQGGKRCTISPPGKGRSPVNEWKKIPRREEKTKPEERKGTFPSPKKRHCGLDLKRENEKKKGTLRAEKKAGACVSHKPGEKKAFYHRRKRPTFHSARERRRGKKGKKRDRTKTKGEES